MRKYIIYGAGHTGDEVYYLLKRQGYEIYGCMDNLIKGEFHGFKILSPAEFIREIDTKKENDFYIIIASNVHYNLLYQNLLSYELIEFEDFIHYKYFFRKIAILNCNCYTKYYKAYLEANKEFSKEYVVYPVPEIVAGVNQSKLIKTGLLKKCDLFIHQNIREDNSIGYQYSDAYLLPKLKPECRCITVPNLVGQGACFFPQIKPAQRAGGRLFKENIIINDCFEKGYCLAEIVKAFQEERYFSQEEINASIQEMLDKLKKIENNWDIKISDFLQENLYKEQLYCNFLHPKSMVLKEICDRLVSYLGYPVTDVEVELDWDEDFMLPYIIPELNIDYQTKKIRTYDKRLNIIEPVLGEGLSLEEYIREYVWFKYGKML